jgi:lysophospholipase L1-like esterase
VPLDQYKKNLKAIVEHPLIRAQDPRILILTPPPINEHQMETFDKEKNFPTPSRTASNTKLYADASREVANSLGIPVADIWTAFMEAAGWQDGQDLPGSKEIPENDVLRGLLVDGVCCFDN